MDKTWVVRLKDELLRYHLKVWIDQDEILPGDLFVDALQRGVEESKSVVLVVSPEAMDSGWVKEEWTRALALAQSKKDPLRLIPVMLRDAELPGFLANRHCVDFRSEADFQSNIKRLVEGITGIRSVPEPTGSDASAADKLRAARNRIKQLVIADADQAEVDAAKADVLAARRAIREGNRLQPGDVLLDRYELLECVGSGGFATVWKCFDDQTMTVVAAKILHPSHREERTKIERFFRGARLMKRLTHDHIVRVLDDKCSDEDFHFYIMEFVDGWDFHEAVLEKRLTQEEVLRVVLEVGDGLHYAHTTLPDLVHRDVKPSNILLATDYKAHVTDFDLVRMADTTGGTRTGSLGTWIYAAPESMEKASEVDVRADVFSLGMTGVFGLYGQNLPIAAFRHTAEFVDSLDGSTAIRDVLKRAVSWELSERFSSMQAFIEAIREAMQPTSLRTQAKLTPNATLTGEVLTTSVGGQLKLISPGEFSMGEEDSQHTVRITQPFYLGVCPVTQGEYERVVGKNPSHFTGDESRPVEQVSWHDAVSFCNALSRQEGLELYYQIDGEKVSICGGNGYRLPTEAEWEYGCRAGTRTKWCCGDDVEELEEVAWYGRRWSKASHAVGQKADNAWGLHDMHGNVWEWCWDWYGEYWAAEVDDPIGPESGSGRVLRGGAWVSLADYCRCSSRIDSDPFIRDDVVGFRLARTYR